MSIKYSRASFKMFNCVRDQERRKVKPQVPRSKCPWGKYTQYFEDSAKASLRAKI